MYAFKDNMGREWIVRVDVAGAKRVRALRDGFDLVAPDIGATLLTLSRDPVLLVDVLFILCKPQCDEAKVEDEKFGQAMGGDSLESGGKALFQALADFTPNPRDRARVHQILDAAERAQGRLRDGAEAAMVDLEKKLESAETSGKSSGTSPESSA